MFTIKQFNTLADNVSCNFPSVPDEYLVFEHRKRYLLDTLVNKGCKPDIICLQEVDHYDDYFKPELSKLGYEGVFQKKIKTPDGVALFWLTSTFTCCRTQTASLKDNYDDNTTNQAAIIADLIYNTNNGIGDGSDDNTGDCHVVIATTHLKAKPAFESLRVKQIKELLTMIDGFNNRNYPVGW